jgi:hypothetical protein
MELEDLYRRYCDRLKHSLFLNSLLITAAGCAVAITALGVFSSRVSLFHLHGTTSVNVAVFDRVRFQVVAAASVKVISAFCDIA